ncbi:sensor histidine kinase [Kordia sp.]|uniref:sensor histidine kinase n=1 Tax=Kordia sp. TaxID=1965332 RepID=UPI003D6A6858
MNSYLLRNPYIFWLIISILYYGILSYWSPIEALFFAIHLALIQGIVVRINTKYLLQKFEYGSTQYKLSSIILLVVFAILSFGIIVLAINYVLPSRPNSQNQPVPILWFFFVNILIIGIPIFVSTFFYILRKEREQRKQIEGLEKLQNETELKFLKSQINPHFLFNALNNIYAISYTGDKSAPEKILMLSDMLRYVLYDCKNKKVLLSRELDYVKSFIEFQQLKTEQPQNIKYQFDKINESIQIAPMMIIPFIENSFKHSKIETEKNASVTIDINIYNNQLLAFKINNTIPKRPAKNWLNSEGGIGLANVKKRLELLYPKNHTLTINNDKESYNVKLTINLD